MVCFVLVINKSQKYDDFMKTIKLHALLLMVISQASYAFPTQPVQSIQDAVGEYVKASLEAVEGRHQIDVPSMDPRLQLPLCDSPLHIFPQSGDIKAGRNTIGVRCNGDKSWTIYSVVSVKTYKDVMVLVKPLRRNDRIRAEDVVSETREISTLSQGYVSNPADVVDKQAARNIAAGSVLNRLCYEDLTLVKRGERVNIQSGNAGLLISAAGTAMTDGAKGQRISVRNTASQRVIQAVVVDAGLVSVYF